MNRPTRGRAGQLRYAGALVTLAAIWLVMLVWGGGPLDRSIYEALYAGHRPVLAAAAHLITALGGATLLIPTGVAVALWLFYAGHRQLPIALIAIVLIGRGLAELQKYWILRARPELEPHLVVVQASSFPSGHATSSMIFYLAIALALTGGTRWHRPAVAGALLVSFLVGVSRVMLGVHWPSDVIGGWAFGMLWVLLTLRIAERYVAGEKVRR
jgi:membrane-associated phospholipid phosphatase